MWLLTHIRLAINFAKYETRLLCVQARLQALSILVYANALQDTAKELLYDGLLEELVELIQLEYGHLVEIRSAALRALTSIIHLDRGPHWPKYVVHIIIFPAQIDFVALFLWPYF